MIETEVVFEVKKRYHLFSSFFFGACRRTYCVWNVCVRYTKMWN